MNTKITITLNGRVAPQQSFQLGYKYENVGDTLTFIIPSKYHPYHHYLAFQRQLTDEEIADEVVAPINLLPVNLIDGQLVFTISNAITYYAGTYKLIFLSTENAVEDGNIEEAHQVFVSNEFEGYVIDSFLKDPINDEILDPNLQTIYDDLLNLRKELEQKLADNYYQGDYFLPSVNEYGWLSWSIQSGFANQLPEEMMPESRNLTGPRGPVGGHYTPDIVEGVVSWTASLAEMPAIESVDLKPLIQASTDSYLASNLKPAVEEGIDEKFRWVWDSEHQSFYIWTDETVNLEAKQIADINVINKSFADEALVKAKKYTDEVVSNASFDTTGLATETYVNQKIADLVDGAPATLDTLNELGQAYANNKDLIDVLNAAIVNKVDKVEGKQLSTNDFDNNYKNALDNLDIKIQETLNAKVLSVETNDGEIVINSSNAAIEDDTVVFNYEKAAIEEDEVLINSYVIGSEKAFTEKDKNNLDDLVANFDKKVQAYLDANYENGDEEAY
jgi:hypothetical protein